MKNLLLLLAITLSTLTQAQTYADKASKETIEKMEGKIYKMNAASHQEGYDSVGYVTTFINSFYSGYFTVKNGMIYKCSRRGKIKALMFNKDIYASYGRLGSKVCLIRNIEKHRKILFHIKKEII